MLGEREWIASTIIRGASRESGSIGLAVAIASRLLISSLGMGVLVAEERSRARRKDVDAAVLARQLWMTLGAKSATFGQVGAPNSSTVT